MNIDNSGVWVGDHGHVAAETISTGAGSIVIRGNDPRLAAIDADLRELIAGLRSQQGPPMAFAAEELQRELATDRPDRGRLERLLGAVGDAVGAIGPAGRLVTLFAGIDSAIRGVF
jgi:hypothetical protein